MRTTAVACAVTILVSLRVAGQTPTSEMQRAAEEFKTLTRVLGLRADSPVQASSRRGARSGFHGRLYHNLRNDLFDAVPKEVRQRGGDKSLLRRNQFGFNFSGPIVIPRLYDGARRTFFSVTYEGVGEKIGRSNLRTVPIGPERTGDYTDVVDLAGEPLEIYDPSTTRPNPAFNGALPVSRDNLEYLRDPFPARRIPSGRLDPAAQAMLSFYPLPNANAGPFWRNNYFSLQPETNRADGMIVKVDHTFLEKHRLNATSSFTNGLAGSARFYQTLADSAPPDRDYQNRRVSAEHVWTISPQSVNTATAEASRDVSINVTGRGDLSSIGALGSAQGLFPRVTLGSYLPLGRTGPESSTARNTFVFTDAHSIRRGKFNVRAVAQFVRYQVNTYVPVYPAGWLRFGSGLTSLPGIVNTGLPFAGFLLGLADYGELSLIPSPNYYRGNRAVTAVQNTWEMRPDLTLGFGLGLEMSTPRTERYDRQTTVSLTAMHPVAGRAGALVAAGRNGQGRSFQPFRARYEPNASLAWNPGANKKSVLRVSYGASWQPIPVYNGHWGTQGFNGFATYYSLNTQLEPALFLTRGFPAPVRALPDLRPEAADNTSADLVNPTSLQPFHQSAGLSYERELPRQYVVSSGLSASRGRNLLVGNAAANPNAIHPDNLRYRDQLNNEIFNRSLRPYPQYLGFDVYSSWPFGRYRREAFFVRTEKRTSQGLSLNALYEFSSQRDDYSGPFGSQDFFNRANEWSLTAYNSPHRLSLSYMYELPFGPNKPFLSSADWRRWLSAGWSVSGISGVSSGEPLPLRPQFNNTGGVLQTVNVDVVPGVSPKVRRQGPDLWFNPGAFSHPADFAPGNASRTHPTLRNPISQNHDLSLSKRIPLDAERSLEFNASGFNFLNHANWTDPDILIGPAGSPNLNAGRIIGSRGGRVIQMGLRFSF